MKNRNGFRTAVALLLALVMILGNGAAARAEEPEVTVTMEDSDNDGKYDVTVDIPGDTEEIAVDSNNAEGFAITVGNSAVDPNTLTRQNVDSVTVNVENAGQITTNKKDTGINIAVYDPIDVTVNAENSNIVATGTEWGRGLSITVDYQGQEENKVEVQVGNIEANSAEEPDYPTYGVEIYGYDKADINVNAGNISAGCNGDGVHMQGKGIAVTAYNESDVGISAGNVTVKDVDPHAIEVINFDNSVTAVVINGNAEAEGESAKAIDVQAYQESAVTIAVLENGNSAGDVIATGGGAVGANTGVNASVDLFIEGTVFGSDAGVNLGNNTEMAAWQITAGEEGTVIKKAPNPVNYLIKLAEGLTNQNVSTANHKTVTYDKENNKVVYGDETTENEYAYHTAVEEEDVTLSFQLQENEELDGVYYNAENKDTEGKINEGTNLLTVGQGLTKQEDGSLQLKMLRGGGMLLGLKTHVHNYVYDSTITPATCTEAGEDLYKCSTCGATQKRVVSALGHDWDTEWTTDGTKHWHKCTRCTAVSDEAAHTPVDEPAIPASCLEIGLSEGSYCSVCYKELKEREETPALGHDWATEWSTDETKHWHKCTRDGCEEISDEAEHTPAAAVKENEKAAQVGVAGSYDEVVYCSVCKKEISRETVKIAALPEPEPAPEPAPVPVPEPEPAPEPQPAPEEQKQGTNTAEETAQAYAAPVNPGVTLTIRSSAPERHAEIVFRNDGTYQLKSPKGGERGCFELTDGQIVLTSETGKKMPIEDGKLTYTIGDGDYVFEFSEADLEKLAAVKK